MPEPTFDALPLASTESTQSLRLPDRGPRYTETPPDVALATAPVPAEPFNTVTASNFIVIALGWAVVLRGRYRQFAFLTVCIPILLAGGIGGTLYHATRARVSYFLLDVIPISLLALASSLYLVVWCSRGRGWRGILTLFLPILSCYVLMNMVLFQVATPSIPNLRVNLNYASLAVVILTPIGFSLALTRGYAWRYVAAAVMLFAIAWLCRLVDYPNQTSLPMGTHWLWHLFGAGSTQCLTAYLYRLTPLSPPESPPSQETPASASA